MTAHGRAGRKTQDAIQERLYYTTLERTVAQRGKKINPIV
jgi:hypothetical protein